MPSRWVGRRFDRPRWTGNQVPGGFAEPVCCRERVYRAMLATMVKQNVGNEALLMSLFVVCDRARNFGPACRNCWSNVLGGRHFDMVGDNFGHDRGRREAAGKAPFFSVCVGSLVRRGGGVPAACSFGSVSPREFG